MGGKRPPEPPGLPVMGHTLRWIRNPFTVGSWVNETAGGVARIELLNTELVVVTDPEHIREVLIEKRGSIPKSGQYEVVFGEGLASVSGEQWKRQRDVTGRFFEPRRIDARADRIVSLTEDRIETWSETEPIRAFEEMKSLTLSVLFETVFDLSIDPDGEDEDIKRAVEDLDQWFKPTSWVLPEWVPTPARRRFRRASDRLDSVAEELLERADAGSDGLLATLQELNRQGDTTLSREEITSQLRTFLFAGHETTASTLSFALQLLGSHPDVQSRFHDELDSVCGEDLPGLSELSELETTENILNETLRLYPPPFRIPRVAAEDVDIGGYHVGAGTDVLVYTVAPHRDERFWDRPMEFRPERWSDLDPDTLGCRYLPFGAGPRSCIGRRLAMLEMRLVLATIGRTYRLESRSELEIAAHVAATPKGSLQMDVDRR